MFDFLEKEVIQNIKKEVIKVDKVKPKVEYKDEDKDKDEVIKVKDIIKS